LINPIYVSLPARTQKVFVQEEWFGPGAARLNGSFHALWTDTGPATLSLRGAAEPSEIDGIGPIGASAKSLWLPLVPERDTAADRRIRIFGGISDAEVTVVFRNSQGSSAQLPETHVSIPANGIADIFPPAAGESTPAYADIEATIPVRAKMEVSGGWDTWSIEAQPVPGANSYFLPHAEWNGIYTTHLVFVNPSDSTRRVQVRLYRRDGSKVLPEPTLTLDPYSSFDSDLESLFSGAGGETGAGWIASDAPDGPVVVVALAIDPRTGAAAASAVGSSASGLWSLPFYVESAGYWTGLAIANVSDTISNIEITAMDRNGNELGHLLSQLEPGQSDTKLVFQWLKGLTAGTTGQITIATSERAAVLAYFGTDDGRALAAIPLTLVIP